MSVNRVNITGNLTRDPELRATKSGTSVLTLGVAVNDRRKNPQTGEWEDYPNFIDCTVFGRRADSLSKILAKGMKVAIEGKLHYSSWEKDGMKRSKITVNVDEVEFLSQRNGSQGQHQSQGNDYSTQGGNVPNSAPQQPTGQFQDEYYDESIPF